MMSLVKPCFSLPYPEAIQSRSLVRKGCGCYTNRLHFALFYMWALQEVPGTARCKDRSF